MATEFFRYFVKHKNQLTKDKQAFLKDVVDKIEIKEIKQELNKYIAIVKIPMVVNNKTVFVNAEIEVENES